MVQGVHADEQGRHIFQHPEGRFVDAAVGQGRFPVAVNAFIRIDSAKKGTPSVFHRVRMQKINFYDFHRRNSFL